RVRRPVLRFRAAPPGDVAAMSRALSFTARILNDVGLAAWFAGSLHPARTSDPRVRRATQAAVALHTAGAAYLTIDNRERIAAQRGVFPAAALKALFTTAALALHLVTELRRRGRSGAAPGEVEPLPGAEAALTGAALFANSVLGEQQRPREVARGVLARLLRLP
ncbi:MAG TPA: hypothetical protein VNT51_01200, partial [Miltoncostaeaceae bacterium]|nr:hypothetical protein [Miltoncostaeaceae bacterium]